MNSGSLHMTSHTKGGVVRYSVVVALALLVVMARPTLTLAGPGSVVIKTDGDITATFGGQVRVIPVYEQDWDFGIKNKTTFGKTSPLGGVFRIHLNEAGIVSNAYIRSEDRLYFNFAKGDLWDVYMALEWDDVLSSRTVDRVRDAQGTFGSFGLERLNASIKLPWIHSRLHAGWDLYGVDFDAALLVYGDDDPGFWLKGGLGSLQWQFGYHRKDEANRVQTDIRNAANDLRITAYDNDRDIYSARVDYSPAKHVKIALFYTYDRLGNQFLLRPSDPCDVIPGVGNPCPKVDSHHIGPIVTANVGGMRIIGQYVHQFGTARRTGVITSPATQNGDYDIDANAFYLDISYDLSPWIGFRFVPHVGVIWASGDDNPNDATLGGYVGNVDGQRFTSQFGGENTILGDFNLVVGTNLYSFIPNLRGNQHPGLVTGGLLNNGRGDSPGLLLAGGGVTVAPLKHIIYRTNAYYLRYDERPCVNVGEVPVLSVPSACPNANPNSGMISNREIGVAWDNEIMVWLDKNVVVKGQVSFLFPGDAIRDVTRRSVGEAVDETAIRLALELLWNF
jgi:hypothetical protein